jgi:hypothetical protein
MHFDTTAYISELPAYYRRAIDLTTWAPWRKRIDDLKAQARENPFLAPYIQERHRLELAMDRLHSYQLQHNGRFPKTLDDPDDYHLGSFLAMATRVHQRLSADGKKKLEGQMRGGLNDNTNLPSLAHEPYVAQVFMKEGFDIVFHDMETGGGVDTFALPWPRCSMCASFDWPAIAIMASALSRHDPRRTHLCGGRGACWGG